MNNNRGNNRRRGRGNNNRGPNGGQQLNRIDSRARGNAPQLLEKYKKMAEDAHRNGDRVTAEYYFQHADHYFRVLADTRVRTEEQRPRRDDRWQEGEGEEGDFGNEGEYSAFDQPSARPESRQNEQRQGEPRQTEQRQFEPRQSEHRQSEPRQNERRQQTARQDRSDEPREEGEGVSFDNPGNNPFVRDNRTARVSRQQRESARPRRSAGERAEDAVSSGLDPATLPPAIGGGPDADDAAIPAVVPTTEVSAPVEEAKAEAPKRRVRRTTKRPADDAGEALATVES